MTFRFDAVRLRHVRGFGGTGMALEGITPGLNVLSQPNEFGKSTILAAIKAALFFKATADNKIVKSLYGFDGDPPEIELDFTADGEAHRLSKRFRKGRGETKLFELPSGTELAREADAEREVLRLLGADKPDAGAGGLLWVEQGAALTDLQAAHKTTIAEALASEVSDAVSSGEALRVNQALAAELAEFETAKTGKPTKRLLAALTDVENAETALKEADAKLAEAVTYRSRLIELEGKLVQRTDTDDVERFQAELGEARGAVLELQKRAQALGHTEQDVARLEVSKAQAVAAHDRFGGDLKRLKNLNETIGMAAENEAELSSELGHTTARASDLAGELADLEERQRSLAASLRQADAFERYARNRAEHELAKTTLADVRRLAGEKRAAEAVTARGPINLNELRDQEREAIIAEAALDAASPEIELLTGDGVTLDGEPLAPETPIRVRGEAALTAGDVRIAVRSTAPLDLAERHDKARRKLAALLEGLGVATVDEAQAEAGLRQQAEVDLKRLADEIKRLAPKGLSDLETIAEAEPAAPEGEAPAEPREALEQALTDLETELEPAKARLNDAKARVQAIDKKLVARRAELEITKTERDRLAAELGPEEAQNETLHGLAAKVSEQVALLTAAEAALGRLRGEQKDLEAAERRVKRLEEAEANRAKDVTALKVEIGQLEGQLMQVYQQGPDETRDATAERLEAVQARLDRLEARRAALKRLKAALDNVQSERRDRLLKPLVDAAAPLVDQVFGASALRFGSDLTPEKLERSGREQALEVLSAGAREQIAIVTRLGLARLFASRGQAVPLILDDAMIYADDARTDRLFDALHMVAEDTQVIVLTCHDRKFDALGGHRLRPQPFPASA
ncbi:MAG: AAA family ATPase [Pseudomonadota bacterium]